MCKNMLKLREFQCVKVPRKFDLSQEARFVRVQSEQESEKADECLYVLESYVVFERTCRSMA